MNIFVIGSGGREHALVWKISQSSKLTKLYCAPGNPGIEALATCIPLQPTDLKALLDFALTAQIDLTVVGPEQPLAEGIVDLFIEHDLPIFGPSRMAAELEWSKKFAKEFMLRHGIPTASFRAFNRTQHHEARLYVQNAPLPIVLKADGLAGGKGVVICADREEALGVLETMMAGGQISETVVIEEFMEGEEASVFAISDGKEYVVLPPAQDHKRVFDGDKGKNTGGMGAYAPAPVVTLDILRRIEKTIIQPTLAGMASEGRPYRGCLYIGLMISENGPKVVEFNCRFGDPETQVVLPLVEYDIVDLMMAASEGRLSKLDSLQEKRMSKGSAVCVVLTSRGYPDQYPTGIEILGLHSVEGDTDVRTFHAGTKRRGNSVVTAGGRVLCITAIRPNENLAETIDLAYQAVRKISFEGMHYRNDIGKKALSHHEVENSL